MRHDFLLAPPLAVTPSAPRMREAPGTAVLVAPAGLAQRLAPRALAPAVALAAVAAAAHQHLDATACAGECPCAALLVALPSSTHAWLAAKRAREINSYYNQLGEGRGEFVPPLVETGFSNKPLSIALEEIAEGKIDYERPEEPEAE